MTKILVVDDQVTIRKLVGYRLEKSGHEVVFAENGIEATEKLAGEKFDLAILDISMPEKTGLEVLQHIRSDEKIQALPVIMLTASALSNHHEEAMAHKADAYLTKPVSSQELHNTVEALLNK